MCIGFAMAKLSAKGWRNWFQSEGLAFATCPLYPQHVRQGMAGLLAARALSAGW
jgi:hypothetical protein